MSYRGSQEKASAVWIQEEPEKLMISKNNGEKVIIDRGSEMSLDDTTLVNRMTPGHPSGFIEAFANLYNDIYNSLTHYKNNESYLNNRVFGFEHAKDGIWFLHQSSVSNNKKQWVKI